ncbi:tRNA pseudouridine(38-40) synthase TruA [Neofamilia massiliensis]|uniref:tRNA pseudouridine(38-40) synthase TruA n=1 Tax=Neofamilia massiliensis TaxID=1673724 RepID=UPI000ABF9A25|nr:tRNA pseudouridine(38-40) synthase TruA [Neofamilia massiliensis]
MINIALKVSYKGKAYAGFQIQPDQETIQGVLEDVLSQTFKEEVKVVAAGRTDAGVHALGQVINFQVTKCHIDIGNLPKVLNYKLPEDISIIGAAFVDENFSARFSAQSKIYKYVIYNNRYRSALYGDYSFCFPHYLDVDKMREAAKAIVGTHDFQSFMGRYAQVKDSIRTIYSVDIKRKGDFVEIVFHGQAFLKNMIRILVGSLCDIGRAKLAVDFIEQAIKAKDRTKAGFTAPACGLFLMEVIYDQKINFRES